MYFAKEERSPLGIRTKASIDPGSWKHRDDVDLAGPPIALLIRGESVPARIYWLAVFIRKRAGWEAWRSVAVR